MRHASTRAELGRAQEEMEEEMAAIARRYDAAVARSEGLQRELGEQQAAASREAEAAAAALHIAMETSAGQDAGAKQAAQVAQAAAEQSVRGLQGQVNDLDQKLKQALAQVCSSRTRKALPEMSTATRLCSSLRCVCRRTRWHKGSTIWSTRRARVLAFGSGWRQRMLRSHGNVKSAPVARVPYDTQQRMRGSKTRVVLCCAGGRAA